MSFSSVLLLELNSCLVNLPKIFSNMDEDLDGIDDNEDYELVSCKWFTRLRCYRFET